MRKGLVCLALVAAACFAAPTSQARDLSFDERVAAQETIEQVYWNHRIWPKENPGPKPPLSAVMPAEALRAKVEDYLEESNALETWWRRPITGGQLQAELDRMSANTRDGAMLRELYEALGSDAFVIAETLARQTLAERLVRNWYAYDSRFHSAVRAQAEAELAGATSVTAMRTMGGTYSETTLRLERDRGTAPRGSIDAVRVQEVSPADWDELLEDVAARFGTPNDALPVSQLSALQEDPDGFFVTAVLARTTDSMTVATVTWRKVPFDTWWDQAKDPVGSVAPAPSESYSLVPPQAGSCADDSWSPTPSRPESRFNHTAVWTGAEMIVWGGLAYYDSALNTGARYNPSTDIWLPTSLGASAPSARVSHTAVWTGTEMIIWGGYDPSGYPVTTFNSGGRYDPSTDRWTATSLGANVPAGRAAHTAIWTGTEMIVWGGTGDDYLNTGARYSPSADSWAVTSTAVNVPSARTGHSAVWTGTEMIIWGGTGRDAQSNLTYFDTGGRYYPSTDRWVATGTSTGMGRYGHTAVWTGTEMIVWGGWGYIEGRQEGVLNTGGRYNPLTDNWAATSTGTNVPAQRASHRAVWTGSEMIVWGGWGAYDYNSGGRYNPTTDRWLPTSTGTNVPAQRYSHTAVWTGSEMIVWGGRNSLVDSYPTGGRYNPFTDSWVPTATGDGVPTGRSSHSAVWTGSEMIVWGGYDVGRSFVNSGGRYDPARDTWSATSTTDPPSARDLHTAVWTGRVMVVWGGWNRGFLGTGGRYDPATDRWTGTSAVNSPAARYDHTAIWTGGAMVVWGGCNFDVCFDNGGRYDPITDTWTPTSTLGAPSRRGSHASVWTGHAMLVWGGSDFDDAGNVFFYETGGLYDAATDTWTATSTAGAPSGRGGPVTAWTGRVMVVWGGRYFDDSANLVYPETGGRYDPATDTWTPTSTAGAPSGRGGETVVWTGRVMVVWGGYGDDGTDLVPLDTGSRYDPATDLWTPTSLAGAPSGRFYHTAVWTGREMVVWGGYSSYESVSRLGTGGRYLVGGCASPVASAGPDLTLECAGDLHSTATLDGSGSTDSDSSPGTNDDIVRFDWTEGGSPLASGMIVSVPFRLGIHDVTLAVTDRAGATASDDSIVTVIDTTPPWITCPASIIAECQSAGQAYIALSPATASDSCSGTATLTNSGTPNGPDASGSYPLGTTILTFTATDGTGNQASCQTTVIVRDTIPPAVAAVASPGVLWPPNRKMSVVNTTVVATDACDPSPSIVLASVVSSEPDDAAGSGDGETTGDIQGAAIGTPDFQVLLRAERDGNGPGRTYTIAYQTSDHSGNAVSASAQVAVPHDMSQGVEPLTFVVEGSRDTTLIWGPVEVARNYDVIRGDLANLRIDGSTIDLGQVVCIARDTAATTTMGYEDTTIPAPGQVFFYAVQYNDGREDSSYGSESAGRARVVKPNSGDCS